MEDNVRGAVSLEDQQRGIKMRGESPHILIEVCVNCKTHQWCTRHDEVRQEKLFEECKQIIEAEIPGITVQKNTDIDKPRLGAFEIYYHGKCVYSKIITGLFPVPKQIVTRVKQFIDDCKRGKDVSDYPTRKEKRQVPPRKPRPFSTTQSTWGGYAVGSPGQTKAQDENSPEKRKDTQEEHHEKKLEEEQLQTHHEDGLSPNNGDDAEHNQNEHLLAQHGDTVNQGYVNLNGANNQEHNNGAIQGGHHTNQETLSKQQDHRQIDKMDAPQLEYADDGALMQENLHDRQHTNSASNEGHQNEQVEDQDQYHESDDQVENVNVGQDHHLEEVVE